MRVYFDHNATSPLLPQAKAAMLAALEAGGNPSSVHGEGRAARQTVEDARRKVAALVGAKPGEVVFTSGGSEANALALRGLGVRRLLVGQGEHDSVLATADALASQPSGPEMHRVGVGRAGQIDVNHVARLAAQVTQPTLLSVMLANNETGVIAEIANIVDRTRSPNFYVHCDAAQAIGRIRFNFKDLGVNLMTLSAHKFGGPLGVGALILRDGLALKPQITGGGQELGRRAGTENVVAIAGFGAAAEAVTGRDWSHLAPIRDWMEQAMLAAIPEAIVYGAEGPRLPNTSMIGLPGVPGETQVMAMDLEGFAISSGSACSSGKVKASHVLAAMGAGADAGNAIRISLGPDSTEGEARAFVTHWTRFAQRALQRRRVAVAA